MGSKCCWGQCPWFMRTISRMCRNESQPGLQLVEKLAMPLALLPFNAITGCDCTSFICADTVASAVRFVCSLRMTDQEINWTLLAPSYLSNSITQRSYALFAMRSSNTWEMPLPNHGLAPGTDSKRGASAPWGDRMNAEDEHLLVPFFMTLDPILEACLEWVSNWFTTSCAVNTVRCMSCALGSVDVLRTTLTAASTDTRLC